jgi:hypothetical protein
MAVVAASEPRKLSVWPTIRASYAIVLRNFGQLIRICWLWLLIIVPIHMAAHWLTWPSLPEAGGTETVVLAIVSLAGLIYLPALASIEVAWHRLILLGERVEGAFYLRLDRIVWRYALAQVVIGVLVFTPFLLLTVFHAYYPLPQDLPSGLVWVGGLGASTFIAVLLCVRMALVLPSIALGESLSPMDAWRVTRGNTKTSLYATGCCAMPLAMLWLAGMLADTSSRETYALVNTAASITSLLLAPPWVAAYSLLYRFFVLQRADLASPARP